MKMKFLSAAALLAFCGGTISPANSASAWWFLYSGGTYTTIAPPGSTYNRDLAINDPGQILGVADYPATFGSGYLYSGGTYSAVGSFPGSAFSNPMAINNSGQIVGTYYVGYDYSYGFLRSGANFTQIGPPSSNYSIANAINNVGQIVGNFVIIGVAVDG